MVQKRDLFFEFRKFSWWNYRFLSLLLFCQTTTWKSENKSSFYCNLHGNALDFTFSNINLINCTENMPYYSNLIMPFDRTVNQIIICHSSKGNYETRRINEIVCVISCFWHLRIWILGLRPCEGFTILRLESSFFRNLQNPLAVI